MIQPSVKPVGPSNLAALNRISEPVGHIAGTGEMTSIRKREWTNAKGEQKGAWLVDYRDQAGKRRFKQFDRKKEADAYLIRAGAEVQAGTHTADSQSITVEKAGELWLARARRERLEPTTIDSYEQHLRLHIKPFLGGRRLNRLTTPAIEAFRDELLDNGRSRDMVRRVLGSLTSLIGEAKRLGHVAQNAAEGVSLRKAKRDKPKPVIPTKNELRQLIEAAGRARPGDKAMMLVLIFAGLRASELRGLPWRCVDLKAKTITIEQRADRSNTIGPPKSASGRRIIPIPDIAVAELRRWRLQCPKSEFALVFPSRTGTPQFHPNVVLRFLQPIQIAAGVSRQRIVKGKPILDEGGKPVIEGRYTLHSLRHAAASLWIEQRVPPKKVQTWMGHHSIQVTFDIYGHLFAAHEEDAAMLAAMASSVLEGGGSELQAEDVA